MFVAIVLILAAVLIAVLSGGGREGVLTQSSLRMELSVSAAMIRNETPVSVERYDRVRYLVKEGAAVTSGLPVAEVYKWGYSDEMAQSLVRAQKEVFTEQLLLLEGIANPGLETLQNQIEQKKSSIASLVMNGGEDDLLTLQNELTALLGERADYLKANVQPTEKLTGLYAAEDQQKSLLAGWKSEVSSVGNGVASFAFDGFEQVISVEKLSVVNADLIKNVIKSASGGTGAVAGNLLYRLVDSNDWYIAFVTNASDVFRVAQNEQYAVVFEGYAGKVYTGTALEPIISEGGVVNLLHFTEDIGALLDVRSIKAAIQKDATGFDVPLEALTVKDGVPGLTLLMASSTSRVEVEVLGVSGDRAVVRAKNPGDVLGAGQRYVKGG